MPGFLDDRLARELATESIVVKIRWFGIAMGYALVVTRSGLRDPWAVAAILGLGAIYALLDTFFSWRGDVFLRRWPLSVSLMESLFISLLCYFDTGVESPFRWYYLLSLVCCSIRYVPSIAWMTFGMHSAAFLSLSLLSPPSRFGDSDVALTIVIQAWVTWASSSLSGLLRSVGERLELANAELKRGRDELEARVIDRTAALRDSLARELQKEKMSAFGLLAAGIAHEVGNPLAAVSSLIQVLQRRRPDAYTAEKLEKAGRQVDRIHRTIRELVDFSRPVSNQVGLVRPAEVVEEALGIVKYYHRTKGREIQSRVPTDLPTLWTVRDHLTQVLFNLLLNAIDATDKGGRIGIRGFVTGDSLVLTVEDNGPGITEENLAQVFQPYFSTKPQGTGLGLFVSRQIIQELGGTLDCESQRDRGACFLLKLPLSRSSNDGTPLVGDALPDRAVLQEVRS